MARRDISVPPQAMTAALRFFVLMEVLGLAATPLAVVAFARLPGRGVAFAKPLGLLLATWLVWMGGSLNVVPNGLAAWIGAALVLAVAGALTWRRWRPELWTGPARRWLAWSEGIALVAFAAMALLVAYSPDVWQTEKPMDMAFLNAAGDARTFPPEDPWMAGQDLNYYYLGHLMAAGLVRLSGVAPDVGYNLAVATVLALTASAVLTLAGTLWAAARGPRGAVGAGLAAVGLVVVLGDLDGARLLFAHGGPLATYPWFDASRVIPDAIDEFPWFSFLVGDLHAHWIALPFTVLALAFVVQVVLLGPVRAPRRRAVAEALVAAIAIGMLYAINAWSYPVAAGLLALGVAAWVRDPRSAPGQAEAVRWLLAVIALSILLVLPFHLGFDPAARGLGVVRSRPAFGPWLGDTLLLYGSLLPLVALAFLGRARAFPRPPRRAVVAGLPVAG